MNSAGSEDRWPSAGADIPAVHTLLIAMDFGYLLVPSAMVAEVLPLPTVYGADVARHWILGQINWRGLSIRAVSFERMVSDLRPTLENYSRIVVFYPLPGRGDRDYFGILSSKDPRSTLVNEDLVPRSLPENVSGRYIASVIEVSGEAAAIPDLDALATAVY